MAAIALTMRPVVWFTFPGLERPLHDGPVCKVVHAVRVRGYLSWTEVNVLGMPKMVFG